MTASELFSLILAFLAGGVHAHYTLAPLFYWTPMAMFRARQNQVSDRVAVYGFLGALVWNLLFFGLLTVVFWAVGLFGPEPLITLPGSARLSWTFLAGMGSWVLITLCLPARRQHEQDRFNHFLNLIEPNHTKTHPEVDRVRAVLEDQMQCFNRGDVNGFIDHLHPKSPEYTQSKQRAQTVLNQYELESEFKDFEILRIDEDEAEVGFEQVTRKISGPPFKENRLIGHHILKPYDGEWKVYNTIEEEVEILNED